MSGAAGIRRVAALACAAGTVLALAPVAQALPHAPSDEFYGVSPATDLSDAEYEAMARGGVHTIRVPFYWPHFELEEPAREGAPAALPNPPGNPEIDRTRFWWADALVERAAANGIRVLPFVYGTPGWLADDPMRPPIHGASQRREWQRFLGDLVARYGQGGSFWLERAIARPDLEVLPITAWQIWNEQNSRVFWSPRPSAPEYARLLRLAASAIRDADPQAVVVLGGMFATPSNGIRAARFLTHLRRSGTAAGAFDAYALHPYSPNLRGIVHQVRAARRALRRTGAVDLPLWITEIGWPTSGRRSFPLVKSPQGQKRMLARSYRLLLRRSQRWNLERLIWYTWRDNNVMPGCIVCRFSGLFDRNLNAKPAWRKLAQIAGGSP